MNLEAEMALLGGLLCNNKALAHCGALASEHFVGDDLGSVFAAIQEGVEAGRLVDAVSLKARFDNDLLASLLASMVAINTASEYARVVLECAQRRQLIEIARNLADGAFCGIAPVKLAAKTLAEIEVLRASAPPEKVSELYAINPVDLEFKPVPDREWIVPEWLPVGCTTASYGDGGVGKTLLTQQLMTCAATGTPWCGQEVTQCRSFGVFCEDDEDELHRRQNRICDRLGIRFSELGAMRWISGLGEDNTLATFTSDGRMQTTERYDAIETAAKDHGAALVVLDTAADLFAGNENDRQQVRRFIGLLNRLAIKIDGAVLLNAHPSRTGLSTGNLDGGSTAWSNSVRSRWTLSRPDANGDAHAPDSAERVLTRRKANYAAVGGAIRLRWVDGVIAPVTAAGGVSGIVHRAAVEAIFLDLLDHCDAQDFRVSSSRHAGNLAPKMFAKRPDAQGYKLREFEGAMINLFAKRMIRLEAYGRPGDARQRIVRDAEGEPGRVTK
jgi:RecA-family ATPase